MCYVGLLQAFQYCEVLSQSILQAPHQYNPALVSGVYETASRLKLSDPQRLQSGDEAEDPHWLTQLHAVLAAKQVGVA